MKDLSSGSIPAHITSMSIQMGIGILVQTLYFFTDLYFVSKLGDAAIAGVTSAGNVWFIVLALTQILNVGTVALVSHAVGAKERDRANHVFNQSLLLSLLIGAVVFVGVFVVSAPYMRTVAADAATARAGIDYLYWFAPGLALQFIMVSMFATLRATGMMMPTMIIQVISVAVNILLAPVLIVGWLTGKPMGPAGAGLASSIATLVGVVLSVYYFVTHEKYVAIHGRADGSELARVGPAAHHRLARRARVLPDVDRDGGDLLGHPRLRRCRAGGLRRRAGRDAHHHAAGDGGGVRVRADRGPELRRAQTRARARDLQLDGVVSAS